MAGTSWDLGNGVNAINTILAEEANRIGNDIYKNTLHTSPWIDLTKQSAFPDGMGYQLATLVYDRAITTKDQGGTIAGARWNAVGSQATGDAFGTGVLKSSMIDAQGGRGSLENSITDELGTTGDVRSYVQFGKKLKTYSLQRAIIESPRISLEDLRFAAHRQEQLRAIMDIMTQVTRNTWENRYRDEFDLVADNYAICQASGATLITNTLTVGATPTSFEGTATTAIDLTSVDYTNDSTANATTVTPTANISNAVLDKVYYQLIRKGAGSNAYGRENGRPVFALVCSSEASYFLQTEAGFRDDVRYNNAKVSDLIAPLGIEKSFRGFYHLIDDLAPRYSATLVGTNTLERVQPYSVSGGVAVPNPLYETAKYEAAYVIHPEVCEAQIPNPLSGGNGITFNPVNYRGQFKWTNILNEITNPDGTVGFFRGILASATKPIKTDFGYVILFDRTSAIPAS